MHAVVKSKIKLQEHLICSFILPLLLQCLTFRRVLGGIGLVAPWWPIKAYRPCPVLVENGGAYTRVGQGLDEIAFGRDSTFKPED